MTDRKEVDETHRNEDEIAKDLADGAQPDGTAPDQRTPDDAERSDEHRGINSGDATEPPAR